MLQGKMFAQVYEDCNTLSEYNLEGNGLPFVFSLVSLKTLKNNIYTPFVLT